MKTNLPRAGTDRRIAPLEMEHLIRQFEKPWTYMHGFLIWQDGAVIGSHIYKPWKEDDRQQLYSVSKSYVSTAVGFAYDEKLLNLDDKVCSFFPEYEKYHSSPFYREMTIRHLLTMSGGQAWEAIPVDPNWGDDWIRAFFEMKMAAKPGTAFSYNSGYTYMAANIVERVTGKPFMEYMTEKLFAPLGYDAPYWDFDPKGHVTGGWGLHLRLEDMAKLGILYLQKGWYNGLQILSEEWITLASGLQIPNDAPDKPNDWRQGYGFQFWRCTHNAYRADGAYGQYIIVMPDQNAVVAVQSEAHDMQMLLDVVWDEVLPLLENRPGNGERRFLLDSNRFDLTEAVLLFDENRMTLRFTDILGKEYPITCGKEEYIDGKTSFPAKTTSFLPWHGKEEVAIRAQYTTNGKNYVCMDFVYPETPHREKVECFFDDGRFELSICPSMFRFRCDETTGYHFTGKEVGDFENSKL